MTANHQTHYKYFRQLICFMGIFSIINNGGYIEDTGPYNLYGAQFWSWELCYRLLAFQFIELDNKNFVHARETTMSQGHCDENQILHVIIFCIAFDMRCSRYMTRREKMLLLMKI